MPLICSTHLQVLSLNHSLALPFCLFLFREIGFFDNYVIPLAKKLKECSVFNASGDECLNYALKNRDEWLECGQEIVEEMVQELQMKFPRSRQVLNTNKGVTAQSMTTTMPQAVDGSRQVAGVEAQSTTTTVTELMDETVDV